MKPQAGIEFLNDQGLLEMTAESVAEFLFKTENLSKKAIGDYLGEKADFNLLVLDEFIKCHDFTDLILVTALRWGF